MRITKTTPPPPPPTSTTLQHQNVQQKHVMGTHIFYDPTSSFSGKKDRQNKTETTAERQHHVHEIVSVIPAAYTSDVE